MKQLSFSQAQQGFTLIEVLVAMALATILLNILLKTVLVSARSSAQTVSRSEAAMEMTGTQQWLAAQLKEAVYVLPAGETVTLNLSNYNSRKMVTLMGSTAWTTGQNFLAFVAPPANIGKPCTSTNSDGCFILKALFFQPRDYWVKSTNNPTSQLQNPGGQKSDDDEEVLAYYQTPLVTTSLWNNQSAQVAACTAPGVPNPRSCLEHIGLKAQLISALKNRSDGTVRFLLDHVQQSSYFSYVTSQVPLPYSEDYGPGYVYANSGYVAPYVSQVNLSLVIKGSGSLRIPSSGSQMISVVPRNISHSDVGTLP